MPTSGKKALNSAGGRGSPDLDQVPHDATDLLGIFGDAVITARRLEATCRPGGICVSRELRDALSAAPETTEFSLVPGGTAEAKGKGTMTVWYVQRAAVPSQSSGPSVISIELKRKCSLPWRRPRTATKQGIAIHSSNRLSSTS